jgi:hypothetical protein
MAIRGQDGVFSAVVSPKELIGTIEKVETHEKDPTAESHTDPWNEFHAEFGGLGQRLKDTYRQVASEGGPSEDEIKDAFGTLISAWDQVAESVTTALEDPEVRDRLKAAASSFATAVGNTISELGSELKDAQKWAPTGPGDVGGEEE